MQKTNMDFQCLRDLEPTVKQMLQEDLPQHVTLFRDAWARNDLRAAQDQVHAVHGTAAFCKIDSLRETAARLEETLIKNSKNTDMAKAFEERVAQVLQQLKKNDQHD